MGQLSICFVDIENQRGWRIKWIHCFENVPFIFFFVDLASYDQVPIPESPQNKMMDYLAVFDSVVNSHWFMRTGVILLLGNVVVFKRKLAKVPLAACFPDYSGGNDVNRAAEYILWRFNQVNRARLNIYPHLVELTDTSNMRLVLAAIEETIIQNAMCVDSI